MLSGVSGGGQPGEGLLGEAAGLRPLQDYLRVTEINYHPSEPTQAEKDLGFDDKDLFEFIELRNVGTSTLDLSVARFTKGIIFNFAGSSVTSLAAGERVVVVADRDAFAARYGAAALARVAGEYSDDPSQGTVGFDPLGNAGDDLLIVDQFGVTVQEFGYKDSGDWPGRADGWGSTLEILDTAGDYDDPDNWLSSGQYNGSPGGVGLDRFQGIVINEVLTHTDPPDVDAIELANTTAGPIDISGWYLSDASDTDDSYVMYRIPQGTVIPAGGYRVFDEYDFNWSAGTDPHDFRLDGAKGDHVWLWTSVAEGQISRFVAHEEFQAAANGESFGRWPDRTGELCPMKSVTLGGANSGPRVGPVIFSELQYNPGTMANADQLEFIEIYNPTPAEIDLTEWRIRKGVDYDFAAGTKLGAFSTLLVVPFDPANTAARAAFLAYYHPTVTPTMVGPYSGTLSNGGETVQLQRPDEPPTSDPTFYPRLLEDEADYNDKAPWPTAADGGGSSLQRAALASWGHDPAGWTAAAPTPGTVPFAAIGATLTLVVRDDDAPLPGNSHGEEATIPPGRTWLDEWDAFWVEFWGKSANSSTVDVVGFEIELRYNTTVFSALEIEFGPEFTLQQSGEIKDAFGRVDHLAARTSRGGLGDDQYVLLARIRFAPTTADQGLPIDAAGGYVTPSDALRLGALSGRIELETIGSSTAEVNVPAMPVWPVMYDLDDNGVVSLGDLSFFAPNYTKSVGDPTAPRAAASDFDHSGAVSLGDLSFFAPNYLRRASDGDVLYPANFPSAWQPAGAGAVARMSAESSSPSSEGSPGVVGSAPVAADSDPLASPALAWARAQAARHVPNRHVLPWTAVDRLLEVETLWSDR